jgi:hypothetical protein
MWDLKAVNESGSDHKVKQVTMYKALLQGGMKQNRLVYSGIPFLDFQKILVVR